jgi:hypothetical protein
MAPAVECLPSKGEELSSNPTTTKKKLFENIHFTSIL